MSTPLYDALSAFADTAPLRMHMPGHKGKSLLRPDFTGVTRLDFTELAPTDDLYTAAGAIGEAHRLWARDTGFDWCQFLTGGSTQGIHTALTLAAPPGSQVLFDRGCHRSVYHSMALLDLQPVFITRPWLEHDDIAGPIPPKEIDRLLIEHPKIKTICITSPTYYGVLSDIDQISRIVHSHGGVLIVDGAHGLHLPFLLDRPFSGVDLLVASAHKTLPALGQGAVLLGCNRFPMEDVQKFSAVYGTSSPSYPIMASLDLARDWMLGEGRTAFQHAAEMTAQLRTAFPGIQSDVPLDPTRLTIRFRNGFKAAQELEQMGIYAEMADSAHVVFILTGMDSAEDFNRLDRCLGDLLPLMGGQDEPLPPPPLPRIVLSPRKSLFAKTRTLPLNQCQGKIAATQLAPYPPGVPVVAPGELISKKELSYLQKIGYNNSSVTIVAEK